MSVNIATDARVVLARMSVAYERQGAGRIKLSQDGDIVTLLNYAISSEHPELLREMDSFLAMLSPSSTRELIRLGARLQDRVNAAEVSAERRVPFADLYLLQILGLLRQRGFSGSLEISGRGDKGVAVLHLQDGVLQQVVCPTASGEQALRRVAWQSKGMLRLRPGSAAPEPAAGDFLDSIDELIAADVPSLGEIQAHCQYVQRTALPPAHHSRLREIGFDVMVQIKNGSPLAVLAEQKLPHFWQGFFHLSANGQVVASYAPILGKFLLRHEEELIHSIRQQLGERQADGYREFVHDRVHEAWPGWMPGDEFDPLFGSAPYRLWARALEEAPRKMPDATALLRCCQQVRKALRPAQATLLKQLSVAV